MSLGLSSLETKVIMVLAESNSLTIRQISNNSGIIRTDLYRIIKSLEKKGLVDRIISHPTKYKLIPMEKILDTLLNKKKEEIKIMDTNLKELKKQLKTSPNNKKFDSESKFVLIPPKRTIPKIMQAIKKTKSIIKLTVTIKRFLQGTNEFYEEVQKSWSRKVNWKIILESNSNKNNPEILKQYNNPLCEIRFLPQLTNTVNAIYDQKEVFIIENPKNDLSKASCLWSNNLSLIALANDYFDLLWNKTEEHERNY
jgi:sugar-specific transcriptional regulator TrmB